jgi:8-oxo-dGTP diphosphatase
VKTVLVSAIALIDADGRVLLTQRPEGKSMAGLWEFPGGKIEASETPEAAIAREMREELAIDICEPCTSPLTFVSHAYEDFHLLMLLYVCRKWEGIPTAQEGQALAWKYPHEMKAMPMPPADVPLVAALMDLSI